jgi:porphobilinogen synthase
MNRMKNNFQPYRQTAAMREFFAETDVLPRHFIAPLFVQHGLGSPVPIDSLPGNYRFSPDQAAVEAKVLHALGIRAVLLFGIPDAKDATGHQAADSDGVVQASIRAIRQAVPDLVVIADVCLCQYTTHGACACLDANGGIQIPPTLESLQAIAVSYAEAGVHAVAPSGMIDGTLPALKSALAQYPDCWVLSYAMKYHSQFYGPFRSATSAQYDGHTAGYSRAQHQIPPTQSREALRDALLDVEAGADAVMVKPGMPYLDQLAHLRQQTTVPLAVYQVSGEYAMLKQAVANGIFDDEWAVFHESFVGMRRAGADWIVSYYAKAWAEHYATR